MPLCSVIKRDRIESGLPFDMGGQLVRDVRGVPRLPSADLAPTMAGVMREQTLPESRAEAQRLLSEAGAQAEEIRRQAREAGRQEGINQGRSAGAEAGESQIRAAVERVKAVAESAVQAREAMLDGAEADLVNLALDIARVIISQEVTQNREAVLAVVGRAMSQVKGSGHLRLRVSQGDLALVKKHWPANHTDGQGQGQGQGQGRSWEVVSDDAVPDGGCMIDTPAGHVDARAETQLSRVKAAFVQLAEPQAGES
jgi:flagellar assembly protein FliH